MIFLGKYIPTLLRSTSATPSSPSSRMSSSRNQLRPLSAHYGSTEFLRNQPISPPRQRHSISNYQQHALREVYGHRRGNGKIFCSWKCALEWNEKHTSLLYRYHTEKFIQMAAKQER